MKPADYKKALIKIVDKLGLEEVYKILNDKFHTQDDYMKDFSDLMEINKGESSRTYDYMEEAYLIGRKFVVPIFKPPDCPDDVEKFIKNLRGYDHKVWERINLYLEGTIPDFYITKHVETMNVVKIKNDAGYIRYDIRGTEFNGYNPAFSMSLERYRQIFEDEVCVIVFTIEWSDDGYETP